MHLRRVGEERRELAGLDAPLGLRDSTLDIREDVARDGAQVDGREGFCLARHAREEQEVLDQVLHASRRGAHTLEVVARARVELRAVLARDAIPECADLAERLLQIVRRDRREDLELAIAPFEPRRVGAELVRRHARGVFARLARREVARDLGEASELAGVVPQRRDDDLGPEARPVLADSPRFLLGAPVGGGARELGGGLAGRHVFREEEDRHVAAEDLVGRVSLQPLGSLVPADHLAVGIEHVDRVVGDPLDEQSEALFAIAQRRQREPLRLGRLAAGRRRRGQHL